MKFLLLSTLFVIFASTSFAYAEEYIIDIPFGAYNPELNTPAEVWYDPPQISVTVGDVITWYNDDREGHTVTSGEGSGRFGWMGDRDFGKPNGIFDSDNLIQENHGRTNLKNLVLSHIFVQFILGWKEL